MRGSKLRKQRTKKIYSLHITNHLLTCVGKTKRSNHKICKHEKHPHVRGENADNMPLMYSSLETPPRAWGKHQYIVNEQ